MQDLAGHTSAPHTSMRHSTSGDTHVTHNVAGFLMACSLKMCLNYSRKGVLHGKRKGGGGGDRAEFSPVGHSLYDPQ